MEQNNAQGLTEEFFFGSGVMTPDRAEGLIEEYPIFAEDLAGIASDSLPAQLREMADDPEGYSARKEQDRINEKYGRGERVSWKTNDAAQEHRNNLAFERTPQRRLAYLAQQMPDHDLMLAGPYGEDLMVRNPGGGAWEFVDHPMTSPSDFLLDLQGEAVPLVGAFLGGLAGTVYGGGFGGAAGSAAGEALTGGAQDAAVRLMRGQDVGAGEIALSRGVDAVFGLSLIHI